MSLILEALKKAERQHKLGEVPGIGEQSVAAPPSGMRGLGWLMLILFACVMLGLGIYLGGFRLTSPETREAVANPSVEERPAMVSTPQPQPLVPSPVEPAANTETPPLLPPEAQEPLAPPVPKPARPLNDMPSGFVANLPSLNIDIHSYDAKPAKRYVLINMEKYREGDYLAEGPQLIEILPDGVTLEHLGERFIMGIGNQ